jgi:alkanesulfonate monooxygenase SsuD/methylene tetrahydromethanopterin reductase-like flavin-dependent oxidoreductase (luciferase family)
VILALNVVASDSLEESKRLFTSQQQSFVRLRRGQPGLIPPPVDDIEDFWEPHEKFGVERALACTVLGNREQVGQGMADFVERHRPDELLLTANVFDHAARLRSFELAMQAWRDLGG